MSEEIKDFVLIFLALMSVVFVLSTGASLMIWVAMKYSPVFLLVFALMSSLFVLLFAFLLKNTD